MNEVQRAKDEIEFGELVFARFAAKPTIVARNCIGHTGDRLFSVFFEYKNFSTYDVQFFWNRVVGFLNNDKIVALDVINRQIWSYSVIFANIWLCNFC